jgi:putative ABC transport system substrate-binding protein
VIDRRSFVAGVAALAAARAAGAQPTRKVYRIGILGLGTTSDIVGPQPRNPTTNRFLRELRELGYVYGEHFVTEARGAERVPERYPGLAAELVQLQVDVIVAPGPMLPALKQATSTIPVVMAGAIDPEGEGLVRSLGHPGGNFTGLSLQGVTVAKRLELLKELVPGAAVVAVLREPGTLGVWQQAEAAARERGWKLLSLEVRDAGEIEGAFKAATAARAGALLVISGGSLAQAGRIADLAARSRLPAIYSLRAFVDVGGLISYGSDINDLWRRAAGYVDKILKGAKPADLPIEQPTKFELVINLKTAKALGLTIPQSLLLRADEVIQ